MRHARAPRLMCGNAEENETYSACILATLFQMDGAALPNPAPPRGLSLYDVRKIFGFFDPPVTVTNQLILFLSSAFVGPPSPHTLWMSYMEAPSPRQPDDSRDTHDVHGSSG